MLKIISGGQTGVDRAALDAALELGMPCGGWCPAGRLAEEGKIPERYPLSELPTASYSARTERNVAESDGTLLICQGEPLGGTHETVEFCHERGKPHLVINTATVSKDEAVRLIARLIRNKNITVVNVAGPRASQWPDGYRIAHEIVTALLRRLSGHKPANEYTG